MPGLSLQRPAAEALGLRFDRVSAAGRAALAMGLAALWLLGRRYEGLVHDSILYVGIGLRRLDAAAFASDLFFAHGSQDAYTAFPSLYACLIDALGPGGAALALTIAGQASFVAAAALLAWRIVPARTRWWSLALLAAISGYYGGVGVFRIAEPFATARTLAEPLAVLALASMIASRHRIALAALLASALLHPLVAFPAGGVMLLWYLLERAPLRAVLMPFAGATLLGAAVLAALTPGFDAEWLRAVRERSPHLFLTLWQLPDWARLAWGLCVAGIAARFAGAAVRNLLIAAISVGLAGVAASALAADGLGSAFAAALQLWRAHWVLHLLAIIVLPASVAALWRGAPAARAAAVCLAASVCFGRAELPAAAVLAGLAVALSALDRRAPAWIGEVSFRALCAIAACAGAVGLCFEVQDRLPLQYGALQPAAWTAYVHAAASIGGLLPLAALLWLAAHSRRTGSALALAVAALGISLATWDARTPWRHFLEQAQQAVNRDHPEVPNGAQVFWPASGVPAWLLFGSASWYSVDQGAGIVFSRETALEYERRGRSSRSLRAAIDNCAIADDPACRIERRTALELCAVRAGPAYLVLNAPIEGYAGVSSPVRAESGGALKLRLYACRDLRAAQAELLTRK